MAYDEAANIAFDCPGHQGGQFYRKSPAGQIFFKHFGERIFRNDLCNADVDLGDLLIHEGAAAQAQRHAAKVFGADKTYFVLNGTSTSNKVVTNAVLRRGDLVLFDRNNHKSLHQGALVQAGAHPDLPPHRAQSVRHDRRGRLGRLERGRAPGADSDAPARAGSGAAQGAAAVPPRLHPARDLRRHGLQRPQGAREDRTPVRLRAVGRGVDRLQRLPPALRGSQPDAAGTSGPGDAGAVLHAVGAQAGRGLLAGVADPQARRPPPRPAALRRAQALQRVVPDERLHVALLPAVRLAGRQRQDPRGTGRRGVVGSLHRAGHRGAQEAAPVRALLRAHRQGRPGAVVLRSVRARRGDDPRLRGSPRT